MRHVFVETNWVVAVAAPAHHKTPAAVELLARATAGELTLHLPVICISEARRPIFERSQSRYEADRVRQFLLWARDKKVVDEGEEQLVRRLLDQMEGLVSADLERLDETLGELRNTNGVEIFDLGQEMLERCSELSYAKLGLQPFDQAILAAILIRSKELRTQGIDQMDFCELDSDLQPWDKSRRTKTPLAEMYDQAHVWVYGDFLLQAPEKPAGWPII